MTSYREHFDIIADILHIAGRSAKKTWIMYRANLSYGVLQRYLSELLTASLISFDVQSKSYVLTNKGQEFLNAYEEYSVTRQLIEQQTTEVAEKRKVLEKFCATQTNLQ